MTGRARSGAQVSTVAAPVLVQVVTAAGGRCECSQLGCHGRSERCHHETPAYRLTAAPRDPTIPPAQAWRVPVVELGAWCSPCLDSARRRRAAQRAAATIDTQTTLERDVLLMLTATWPDTTRTDPPTGHLYACACWLLGRHWQLAELAARVPGVVGMDEAGQWLDLDALAQAINDLDAARAAWADYQQRESPPGDDDAYAAWEAAGPQSPPAALAVGVMSPTEQVRLRLLAVVGPVPVRLSVDDLWGFDAAGHRLIADWCRAIQAI